MTNAIKKYILTMLVIALCAAAHAASPKPREPIVDDAAGIEAAGQKKASKQKSKKDKKDTKGGKNDAGMEANVKSDTEIGAADITYGDDLPAILDDSQSTAKQDSLSEAQYREEEGQDFSSLFDSDSIGADNFMEIDTQFAWSNSRINSGRFDYKTLGPEDTIRIPLVDSAQGKFFAHPYEGRVTSPFGPRRYLWHYGIDLKLNTGDTVVSVMDGIVRVIQFDRRGYGNVVVVRHHSGLETVYGHLTRGGVKVGINQRVKAGEMVGLGGNTGRSTGAHLHFEIRYFGEPFDPTHIIDFDYYALKSDTLVLTRDNFEYLTEVRKTVVHTVRRGDNLGSIARRYGTTVSKICKLNGITPKTTLRIGRKLVVRSGKEAEAQVIREELPAADTTAIGGSEVMDDEAESESAAAPVPSEAAANETIEENGVLTE